MIEGGLFLLMISVSIIFIIANIRYKEYFYVIPMFIFLVLGMWLMQGETVAFTIQTTDGTTMLNQTSWLIGNAENEAGVEYNIYSPWLGLAFILGAIIMGFVVFLGLTDSKKDPPRK
ncbi:hypothetical protein HOV56_gp18 [Nitrosopumilus spindle-shaped virus]|uniref:Uncharacterized protein n=1 Tax=Nitrosopumilus spindle-shaped virus TaxID=2508184 RepID=A0A514K2T7_9VIRU|nr:hypothetical protein HOV56_gp18 [Nitrosopumilus spindle-shaped virus]YP_010772847.1 hypothetical protein QIT54_gp17 [Nitrosopumilus spindle-shaped virus]QDI73907.1 hypothetical protein [Nitrosopumilus spindle-shaped virus]QDI73955.1 hypothetical protein [Nitrosopumilus spindle-shaped virus]